MKPILKRLPNSVSYKTVLVLMVSALTVACAHNPQYENDQEVEPSFQERVTECSKIADRSERDRCLYG